MKLILFVFSAVTLAVMPSCTESEAKSAERPPENGAQFTKNEGVSLTDEMADSIGLKTAEVTEQKIADRVPVTLRPLPGGTEASGWLSTADAAKVQSGMPVDVSGETGFKGTVKTLETPGFSSAGDVEVVVAIEAGLPVGPEFRAAISLPETEAVVSIPRSALLTTAEGHFVYAKNGKSFFRTGVTVGAMNETQVEITEGLYAGDEVVTTAVMSLWMAELQVLRGGKACTCGH